MAEQSSVGLSRLVALARFIDANPGLTVSEVATHFERTEEQLKRDLAVLLEAGFDDLLPGRTLEFDHDQYEHAGILCLRSPLGLERGVKLTSADLAILLYGLEAIAPTLTDGEIADIPGAISKAAALAGMTESAPLPFIDTINEVVSGDKVQVLRGVIDRGQRVQFDYVSGSGGRSSRLAQPVSLSFVRDGWLLDAIDTEVGSMRSFRLDRMGDLSIFGEGEVAKIRRESRDESETVFIDLDPSAAWVKSELTARRVQETPEAIKAEYAVWDRSWIRTEILTMANYVRGTDPAVFLDDAAEFATNAARTWRAVLDEPGKPKNGDYS